MEASTIANNNTLLDLFKYNIYMDTDNSNDIPLPQGWKLTKRKRSIFELDTNIHTLSELYDSLNDLRNQLPDPVARQLELPFRKPSLLTAGSSTDDINTISMSRSGSSSMDYSSPGSPLSTSNGDEYERLLYVYPDFIFEALMHVYLDCISFARIHKQKLLDQHRQGKLNKAYASAIYAYASLHAILCHQEKFGIYSFLNQLSRDAYQTAFELVEFDAEDVITVETLVIMSQYLITTGYEGEAKNIFCLAQRQISMLLVDGVSQDTHRLFVWMTELDWMYALTRLSTPIIQFDQVKSSLNRLKSCSASDELYVKAKKFELKGLNIILSATDSSPHQKLNKWRSKYLDYFLYKRVSTQPYTLEDKYALRLHAIYFAGMLELHKQHMLSGFEIDESTTNWTDYFHQSENPQHKVEKGLYRSMSAAYGFIQVIRLLLDEKDRCILPQVHTNLTFIIIPY